MGVQRAVRPISQYKLSTVRNIDHVDKLNEPLLDYAPGSTERAALYEEVAKVHGSVADIPLVIGGEEVFDAPVRNQVSPYDHANVIATYRVATEDHLNAAIESAMSARREWERKPIEDRTSIFFRAADLLATTYRARICATTMAGQAKNAWQAEIDAACELIDFFRFNAYYALELEGQQPLSPEPHILTNTCKYRGMEGFVAAIAPFNFTAISGNLAGTPAMMGNVVLWKPSDTAVLSSWLIYQILVECGLPKEVIQFVPADGPTFGKTVTASPDLAAVNFTGSVPTFEWLWKEVGKNISNYKGFPVLVGECGGKNSHFFHPSGDVKSMVAGTIRSAFEYSGQKCSACSRCYIPASLWEEVKEGLVETQKQLKIASPLEFDSFTSTVIDDKSFARISGYLNHAKTSPNLSVVAGGEADDSVGYYIQPTVVQTSDPRDKIMNEEIFGPVVSVFVYPDEQAHEMIDTVATTSPFALTGAVFSKDEDFVKEASNRLRSTCGNFYINDKSTGSVVGQQPFGGARLSGTNDKAGGPHYVMKWCSPQAIKRTHVPLDQWAYANMAK